MKHKPILYSIMLCAMIAGFFVFTGGVTDSSDSKNKYAAPELSEFTLNAPSPTIYAKLPFRILAANKSFKDKDCSDTYFTARELVGTLIIKQGAAVISTSSFIFVSETGSEKSGFTGTFVDSVIVNRAGAYTATAVFYDSEDPAKAESQLVVNFTVSNGSETPLSAGNYQLNTFKAYSPTSTPSTFTYSNTGTGNIVTIDPNGVTAKMAVNIQLGAAVLAQYPFLKQSSFEYNATGNYTIGNSGGVKYFKIEYENNAYVIFNFTFDGSVLTLYYSKDGTDFTMKFNKI